MQLHLSTENEKIIQIKKELELRRDRRETQTDRSWCLWGEGSSFDFGTEHIQLQRSSNVQYTWKIQEDIKPPEKELWFQLLIRVVDGGGGDLSGADVLLGDMNAWEDILLSILHERTWLATEEICHSLCTLLLRSCTQTLFGPIYALDS